MDSSFRLHWQPFLPDPDLDRNTVHLWLLKVAPTLPEIDPVILLSGDEQQRAAAYRFEKDRRQFVVARAMLRTTLGHYLYRAPAALQFVYNAYGKPKLADADLQFSLSHSGAYVLLAVTAQTLVGADLECFRNDLQYQRIAGRFFTAKEKAILNAAPPAWQPGVFYQLWTRKEALLKARGEGFSSPPEDCDVSAWPDGWWGTDLGIAPGYAAALAVAGNQRTFSCWDATILFTMK
ncbi:4'-phosphopantetheinyl transferase family protein [Flavihumibacter petaseus]|uniref:4'-phosphopantetheinyl transferase family protein n=1 Tax=Flavihumibacter petaseus TaxID=549295 RepID=UPI00146FDDB3|nr:4'-phosphopantetheinyl transferase superfamily protein [Flavihumibacter petaseus]